MNTEVRSIILFFLVTAALSYPLGRYIATVYTGERGPADRLFGGLENLMFKWSGIDARREMRWQEHLKAMLTINLVWFFWAMFVLLNQGWLPWNPDGNPSMTPDLAFNTAISFVVNCNLQHYSGETGASYFSQVSPRCPSRWFGSTRWRSTMQRPARARGACSCWWRRACACAFCDGWSWVPPTARAAPWRCR